MLIKNLNRLVSFISSGGIQEGEKKIEKADSHLNFFEAIFANLNNPCWQAPAPLVPRGLKGQVNIEMEKTQRQRDIERAAQRPSVQDVRKELGKKLNDIELTDQIIYEYLTCVRDAIPDEQNRKLFEQWMVGIAYFLGSPFYNHELFFQHQAQNQFFTNNVEFKAAFRKFARHIQAYAKPIHKTIETARKVKNIAILYPGSGGGGHKSPATAMAKDLEKQGYKVTLLDSDEFERPYDPLVDGLTRGEIFSKVYQQEGNAAKAYAMWDKGNEIQPLESRRYMRDLTNTLRDLETDHLFVVAHHMPEHTSLAYKLGLPTTYVHTDNEFHVNLLDVALNQQELKNPLVSFTSLSNDSEFFHHLLYRSGKRHYNELPENVRRQVVRMNFPVRQSFHPVNKEEKIKIRKDLGISPDAITVKVAMGANGIPTDIIRILDGIKREENKVGKPLHVLVLCGANQQLKQDLERMTGTIDPAKIKFQILGFLNEEEMSKFDKASDVWLTKPGGSTSAEAGAMRKQMLYVVNHHHIWELTNAQALERKNLAEEFSFGKSIIDQIEKRAAIGEVVEYADNKAESWPNQLARIVRRTAEPILNLC